MAGVQVKILKVKNRMDPGFDSRAASGYRDLCLNLQVRREVGSLVGRLASCGWRPCLGVALGVSAGP